MSEGGRCAAGAVGKRVAYNCRVHYRDLAICVAEKDALIDRLREELAEERKRCHEGETFVADVRAAFVFSKQQSKRPFFAGQRLRRLIRERLEAWDVARAAKKEQP